MGCRLRRDGVVHRKGKLNDRFWKPTQNPQVVLANRECHGLHRLYRLGVQYLRSGDNLFLVIYILHPRVRLL